MGIFYIVLASLLNGSYPTLQEQAMLQGASPLGILLVCNGIAALSALLFCLIKGYSLKIPWATLLWLIFAGMIGLFLTDYLLNYSYSLIPVGFATTIHFLYPSLVNLFLFLFFRERLTQGKLGAIILSIAGLICLTGKDFTGNRLGILTAIATSFAYAFFTIANDRTSIREIPAMTATFYLNLFTVLAGLILNAFTKEAVLPSEESGYLLCILSGIMIAVAVASFTAGIILLGSGKAALLNMLEPVTSLVLSTLIFHYTIGLTSLIGILLILGALGIVAIDPSLPTDT